MNNRGDLPTSEIGDGGVGYPSLAFMYEPTTGICRDTSGSSTEFVITKRGIKRFYIDDNKTEVIGTFVADDIAPSGNVSLEDGLASAPSLTFQSDPNRGMYKDGTGIGFSVGGNKKFKIDSSNIEVDTTLAMGANSLTSSGLSALGTVSATVKFQAGGTVMDSTGFNGGTYGVGTAIVLAGGSSIQNGSNVPILTESGSLTSTSISNSGTLSSTGTITSLGNISGVNGIFSGSMQSSLTSIANGFTSTGPNNFGSQTLSVGLTTFNNGIKGSGTNSITSSSSLDLGTNSLLSSGSLSSGAITSSGSITGTTGTFSGAVTQPRTWIRQTITSNQSTTNSAAQFISWDSTAATGGSSSNWTFASGTNIVTPSSGMYSITVSIDWAVSSTSSKGLWIEVNSATPNSNRVWAFTNASAGSILSVGAQQTTSLLYYATAGDFFSVGVKQSSGGALNLLTPGTDVEVVKLFE